MDVNSFTNGPLEAARTLALRALWHASKGDWNAAHGEAQAGTDAECAWVHALLHREEGDQWNAEYWYKQAEKPVFRGSIEQEREQMIATLLHSQV